ncbi:hypothetical protein IAT38_006471 [Cryptococcus sp. DSM 104549]
MADPSSLITHSSTRPRSGSPTPSSPPTPPPPPTYPPCGLCRGTYPLPAFTLTTLDPLAPEIRVMIFDLVKTTECRSHLVDLICTSRQLYGELAPVLYQSAVLDKKTAKGFYYGLGRPSDGHGLGTVLAPEDAARAVGRVATGWSARAGMVKRDVEKEEADDMAARWTSEEKAIVLRDTPHPVHPVSASLPQPLRKLALISHTLSLTLADDVARVCTLQAIHRYDLFASALLSKMVPMTFADYLHHSGELDDASRRYQDQSSGARLFRSTHHLSLGEDWVRWMCHQTVPHRPWSEVRELGDIINLDHWFFSVARLDIHIPDLRSAAHPQIPRQVLECLDNLWMLLRPGRIDFHNVLMSELLGANELLGCSFGSEKLHFHLAPEDSRGGCSHVEGIASFTVWLFNPKEDDWEDDE